MDTWIVYYASAEMVMAGMINASLRHGRRVASGVQYSRLHVSRSFSKAIYSSSRPFTMPPVVMATCQPFPFRVRTFTWFSIRGTRGDTTTTTLLIVCCLLELPVPPLPNFQSNTKSGATQQKVSVSKLPTFQCVCKQTIPSFPSFHRNN